MPEEKITLEQIDDLIITLAFKKDSHADVMLSLIRESLKTDNDITAIRSVKTDDIIKKIWPKTTESSEEYKKILKNKRKSVSSIKSHINKQCRNLYWEELNPARIGINRFNVFRPLSESKAEKVQKMQARIMYLEKLIADVAPASGENLPDSNPDIEQAVKQIRKSVKQRRQHGMVIDSGGELILTEEEEKPEIPKDLLPEAQALMIAEDRINHLLGQLEDLYNEKKLIEKKLAEGSISEPEAALRLKRIESLKKSISEDAQKMLETSDIKDLKPEDEELNETLKDLKQKLATIADDENITTSTLNDIVKKGIEALEEINQQNASDAEKEEIKQAFAALKEQAKELLAKTKPLQKKIAPLAEKEGSLPGLSQEEKQSLLQYENSISLLQTECAMLIKKLEDLKKKSNNITKEAIILIISRLNSFLSIKTPKHKYSETLYQEALDKEKEIPETIIPEAHTLFQVKDKINNLLSQMEDLHTEKKLIAKKLEEGSLSQDAVSFRLEQIKEKQKNITDLAESMLHQADIAELRLDDPELDNALNELKQKLITLANNENISTQILTAILEKGIEALEQIEKQQTPSTEDEDIKKTFETLKNEAKNILKETKPLQAEIKILAEKEKTIEGLTQQEKQSLLNCETNIAILQNNGKALIEKLEKLKKQSVPATQEAIGIITSALQSFLSIQPLTHKHSDIIDQAFAHAKARDHSEKIQQKHKLSEETLPEAKSLFEADDKITSLLTEMQELHTEKDTIENKLKNNELSQEEAGLRLEEIKSKQQSISQTAENMLNSDDIQAIDTKDEKLNETLKELKQKLITIAEDQNINTDMLQDIIRKGLDALEEIEKQNASLDEKETVKEEFSVLKARAKTLLKEIRPIQKEITVLSEKEKTVAGLTPEEKQSLLSFENRIRSLQEEGKGLIKKLKLLEQECDSGTKEAIILIISSLEKFLSIEPEKRKYAEITPEVPSDEERGSSPEFLKALKDEKEKELEVLSEEYKKIKKKIIDEQEGILDAREELNLLTQEKSSLAEEKLILKQMDTPLSNKGEEIINNIREKTRDFTKRLEEINAKEQKIYEDIRNNILSDAEGAKQLGALEKEKEKLIEASTKFEEYLNKSKEDSAEDPAVMTLLDRIKSKLQNMQSTHKNLDLKMMEGMLSQGLEALEELDKKEKELQKAEEQETEEDIKKEFLELKTKAKEILKSFKITYPKTQQLIEKEKNGEPLTPEETITLQTNKKTIHSLRKLGEQTLEKLGSLETKVTGPMLEAVVLIKTTLAKFINQDDIKKRLLAKADKSKQAEAGLKSEEGLMQEMLKAKTKIDETSSKIKETEKEIENLEKIYDDLKTELKRKQMVLSEAENKADILDKRKSELLEKINELNIDVAASERMIQMHENQKLMDAANKFRHQLSGILDQKEFDENKLDELIDKGLDAIKQAAGPDNTETESQKDKFIALKDRAKVILKDFKEINKLKKSGDTSQELAEREQTTGQDAKTLADDINSFIDSASGPLREAAVLILSSLKRYTSEIETAKIVHTNEATSTSEAAHTITKERIVERGSGIRSYFKDTFSTEEEALSDFKKAEDESKESKEANEEAKEKFANLKSDAKNLIEKFRDINRILTKAEVEKKEAGGTLPPPKEKELQFYYIRRNHLQDEGKQLIVDLENFKKNEGVHFKEPIGLIISSIKKFISDIVEVMKTEASLNIVKEKVNIPSGYKIQTDNDEMEEKEIGRLKQDLTRLILKLRENLPTPQEEPLIKSKASADNFLEDLNLTLDHFEIGANHVDSSLIEKGIFALKESVAMIKSNNLEEAATHIKNCISEFEKTSLDLSGFVQVKKQKNENREVADDEKVIKNVIHLGGDDDQVNINGKFLIDRFPVTIGQFKKFVDETGYKTKAEKDGYGWVYKKQGMIVSNNSSSRVLTLQGTSSLSKIAGACWYNPDGIPSNSIDLISLSDWPAVHVNYFDAMAYASWVQKRLPTKDEWIETTGMKVDYDVYPWGINPETEKCNNKKANCISLSPVQTYPPNDYEVFDLIGNAWEWCENENSSTKFICGGCWNNDIEDLKHPVINKMESFNANNTIGFRCLKDI